MKSFNKQEISSSWGANEYYNEELEAVMKKNVTKGYDIDKLKARARNHKRTRFLGVSPTGSGSSLYSSETTNVKGHQQTKEESEKGFENVSQHQGDEFQTALKSYKPPDYNIPRLPLHPLNNNTFLVKSKEDNISSSLSSQPIQSEPSISLPSISQPHNETKKSRPKSTFPLMDYQVSENKQEMLSPNITFYY